MVISALRSSSNLGLGVENFFLEGLKCLIIQFELKVATKKASDVERYLCHSRNSSQYGQELVKISIV